MTDQSKPTDGMNSSETQRIFTWLSKLALLLAANMSPEETTARAKAYAAMLAGQYDPRIYSLETLRDFAKRFKFWPSFGEITAALDLHAARIRVQDNPKIAATVRRQMAAITGAYDEKITGKSIVVRMQEVPK